VLRQPPGGLDLSNFGDDPDQTRRRVQNFFAGPEENYPEGLVADLHRIAELANANGLQLQRRRPSSRRPDRRLRSGSNRAGPIFVFGWDFSVRLLIKISRGAAMTRMYGPAVRRKRFR